MDKSAIIASWRAILTARQNTQKSSQQAARAGSRVDGDHRPATRGERGAVSAQGYLAQAFGQRSIALQACLDRLDDMGDGPRSEVVVGALLSLSIDNGPIQRVIILPGGDATTLDIGGQSLTVLSENSPLAHQLRDTEAEETAEIQMGGKCVAVEILAID
jgi:hypothetical protein